MKTQTKIRATADMQGDLMRNLGRAWWIYDGEPRLSTVVYRGETVPVYLLDWGRVPADVRAVLARGKAAQWGVDEATAAADLARMPVALVAAQVQIERVDGDG